MAEEILGLEISLKQLRYVDVKKRQKELIVEKSGKVDLPAFSLSSPGDLTKAIKEIIAKEKIAPKKICLTLSSEDLFIQQTALPKIPDGELKGMIRNQIERIPKFANKAFDFTHATFAVEQNRFLVIFCALTHESKNYYLEAVGRTGLSVESLQISPLNALELFASRLSKSAVEALIVLGDAASWIMVLWQGECKLFFQFAVGRKDLCGAAQEIKQTVFLSWVEELRRVVKSYHLQWANRALERMWLIWDNENAADLAEMLSTSLEIETKAPQLDEYGLVTKDKVFNPAYVLALTGPLLYFRGVKEKFNFNVFLHKIKLQEALFKTGRFIVFYIIGALAVLGIASLLLMSVKNNLLKQESLASGKIETLERQTTQLKIEKNLLESTRNLLFSQVKVVQKIKRVAWTKVFGQLMKALPEDVHMNQFNLAESLGVKLDCTTWNISSIATFLRNINNNTLFNNTQFDFLKEREVEGKKFVDFSLSTTFKNNELRSEDKKP
ncbi:MAG: PilN domain-containing protein [Candidatus Omnitrophica bacterium]|nr:PilN domain-containing protein [Candidatus Omnitrophota bacterium]